MATQAPCIIVNESSTGTHIENYKIVILGDQYVGKTSILSKYKYETLEETYADKTIRLIMWDTAGSERFKSLIPTYLKNANSIILAYDITNKNTFLSLPQWLKDISDKVPPEVYIIVVGNKLDMQGKRQVTVAEAEKFCEENKLGFIEASAKTGENINKIFEIITSSLFESHHFSSNKEKDKTIILDPEFKSNPEKKKKKCCK